MNLILVLELQQSSRGVMMEKTIIVIGGWNEKYQSFENNKI